MNRSFKVVFNKTRGALMVVNEITSSVQAKGTKTVIATAVASLLMVGSALANTPETEVKVLDWDTITTPTDTYKHPTFKLHSGKGQETHINTNANASIFIADVLKAKTKDELLKALGQVDSTNKTGIVTGFAGGQNYWDASTGKFPDVADELTGIKIFNIDIGKIVKNKLKPFQPTIDKLDQQLTVLESEVVIKDGTNVIIGDEEGKSPVLVASVGGDRVVNANAKLEVPLLGLLITDKVPSLPSGENPDLKLIRVGDSKVILKSGNLFSHVNGSSAINVGNVAEATVSKLGITATVKPSANSTTTIIEGNSTLEIEGTGCVAGAFGGGSAIALGGNATSNVTGNTTIVINNSGVNDGKSIDSLSVGVVGGGLAFAGFGGTSSTATGTNVDNYTLLDLQKGVVVGAIGGGVAAAGDAVVQKYVDDLKLPGKVTVTSTASGTASSTSQKVLINLGKDVATAGVIGGGVAFADAFGQKDTNKGTSTATAESVLINIDGPQFLDGADKSKLHNSVAKAKKVLQGLQGSNLDTNQLLTDIKDIAKDVQVAGAHVGNMAGGVAVSRGSFVDYNDQNAVEASSAVNEANIIINGGYNVGTGLGGLAIGIDKSGGTRDAVNHATSTVKQGSLLINGGENVLVTAGGIAFATTLDDTADHAGDNSTVKAEASVVNVGVEVAKGSVDGLFGGGIAIDATGVGINNATASTTGVELTVSGGEVNVANLDPITGLIVGLKEEKPSRGSYVFQTAKLVEAAGAAIVGGGLATGNGALADVNNVKIELNGGKVNGNVVAGGAATLGATSKVTTAEIEIDGAEVTGDVYGGGLAGSPDNDKFNDHYNAPTSHVETTNIKLTSGTLNGDVYLGGFVYDGNKAQVTSSVGTGTVHLDGAFNFKGEKIDGSGADKATLVITGDVDLANKTETASLFALPSNVVIGGFDNINGENGSLKNAVFDFGNKDKTTITGGQFDFVSVKDGQGKTMTLDKNAAVAITGDATNKFVVTNGVLGLGTDATAKDAAHAKGSYAGDAALYLSGTVHLDGKNITVGKTEKPGVAIGKNGMLIVDAGLDKGETANQTVVTKVEDGRINADGGKLHYVNVAEQGLVQIAGTDKMEPTVDNVLFEIVNTKDSQGNDAIGFEVVKDQGKLDNLGLGDFNTDALHQIAGQKDEASQFINDFMNGQAGVALSGADRNAKLKSAFNLGAAAGVQTAGIDSALMGIDEATKRASLTNVFNDGWTGFASVTGNQLKFGDSNDALETKTKLAGVAVGGEYTMGDMTFGALGHFGSGDVKGQGCNSGVKNDVDYYGFQAYAAKRINQFNVVGQLGYVMTKNDITHDVGQSTKVDADVFTMGVRGEMNYAINDTWNAVPYVGLNWLRVSTDGYTTNKGIRVDSTDQDLINMPIGVAISGDCSNVAGWTVRPVVDVAYVHTFGDTDLDATSHVGEAAMGTTLDVWSENVGRFSVGAEARNGNMGFGFKLGGAKGDGGHEEFFGQLNAKYVF